MLFMREKICNAFRSVEYTVWNLLRESRYYGYYRTTKGIYRGLNISEETITDIMLLNLSRRSPYDMIILKLTKSVESQEGADFDLWIMSKCGIIGLKIQAKRLYREKNQYIYRYLDHSHGGHRQIDMLIANAKNYGMAPLYMFYNHWDYGFPYQRYISHLHRSGCTVYNPRNLGVTVASAFKIKGFIDNGKKTLTEILKVSYPVYCLVCYTSLAMQCMSESTRAFLRYHVFREEYKIRVYEKLPEIAYDYFKKEMSKELPLYVAFIVDSEQPHKEFRAIKRLLMKE